MLRINYIKSLLITLIVATLLFSCKTKKYRTLKGITQGTTYSIIYESSNDYSSKIKELLTEFDFVLSTYNDSSMISKINRNEQNIELNDVFMEFYNKSKYVYDKSNGYFDITIGPIIKAWGFGKNREFHCDSASIDSLLNFVGMDKIKIENNRLIKDNPNVFINSNAIAQGQSVDYIASFFEQENIPNYLIEIGGELRVKGLNPESVDWKIGIDKPIEGSQRTDLQAIVSLKNKSLATSGNYRNFLIHEGKKYSHSINPKTGYPVKDKILSATIVADECSIADGFATACMVMGFDKAKEFVTNDSSIEAFIVYSDEQGNFAVFITDGFLKFL